jgi:hypothetical protein
MNASDKTLNKYLGSLYGTIVGTYQAEVVAFAANYGSNIAALMNDMSGAQSFKNTLVAGSDITVTHDLVNRLLGDTVAPAQYKEAVDYFMNARSTGRSWGLIMFDAVGFLDNTTQAQWAGASAQLKARADYNATATEGWASNVGDLSTLRDVFSYAISPVVTKASAGASVAPVPLTALASLSGVLATSAANLGAQSAAQTYTVSSADAGKAILMGAGNDVVNIDWSQLGTVGFLSGGDGVDTLNIVGSGQADGDFFNAYQGVFSNLPIRGFEKITFTSGSLPRVIGSIDGAKEIILAVRPGGNGVIETTIGSIDNGTVVNIDLGSGQAQAFINFFNFPPYDNLNVFGNNQGGTQAAPANVVDTLTFNVTVSGPGSTAYLKDTPAKNLILNVVSATVGSSVIGPVSIIGFNDSAAKQQVNLESLTISSNTLSTFYLDAPVLKSINAGGSTGRSEFEILAKGATVNDGVVDSMNVTVAQGLTGFSWKTSINQADTYVNFTNELKAGSTVKVNYAGSTKVSLPTTKAIFNSDFSEINFYTNQPLTGVNSKIAGSVFDVTGVQNAAVYFKGVAAAGQKIGTVLDNSIGQSTVVKVDSASGFDLQGLKSNSFGLTTFINTSGQGSVIDNIKSSVSAQMGSGVILNTTQVDGGKILWVDSNGNGKLDGNIVSAPNLIPTKFSPDFVIMETTSANLAQFSQAVQLLGFNPVVDPFV